MPQPSPQDQIQFLTNVQRLLDEGLFVASYKFALLLSLADLSIDKGDDSGEALTLSSREIAETVIRYYWRQTAPYPSSARSKVLRQNTDKQAAIVNIVCETRGTHGDSLAAVRNLKIWPTVVRRVGAVIRVMPLWKLQTVGGKSVDFLYENTGSGDKIELRPGVAYCLRKFHALISDLVRGAWVRYVREQNRDVLGEAADLNEFLFGSERVSLAAVRPALFDIQQARCFYCHGQLKQAETHVDHFIAWARYPTDLGHNFVLADNRCNNQKKDRLPACEHLAGWTERNARFGKEIADRLYKRGIMSDLAASCNSPRSSQVSEHLGSGSGGVKCAGDPESRSLRCSSRKQGRRD